MVHGFWDTQFISGTKKASNSRPLDSSENDQFSSWSVGSMIGQKIEVHYSSIYKTRSLPYCFSRSFPPLHKNSSLLIHWFLRFFHPPCLFQLYTLTCLIIVQQILLIFQKISTYTLLLHSDLECPITFVNSKMVKFQIFKFFLL